MWRSAALLVVLATPTATCLLGRTRTPSPRTRTPSPRRTPPPASGNGVDAPLLVGCAAGWSALASTTLGVDRTRATIESTFGLAQTTFEDCVREPAGGLLDLTSVLSLLDVSLLLILAASLGATPRLALTPEDRARAAACVGFTAAGVLVALLLALGSGLNATPVTTALGALAAVTAATAARVAGGAVDAPFELVRADAAALTAPSREIPFVGTFYRSSTLIGLVVGAAFTFSPVSPISIFDAEAVLTRMLRQDFGLYVSFVICGAQATLYRFARDGALATTPAKVLNLLTGLTICLLVNDGLYQVNQGTQALAALDPSDPFVREVAGGDGFRAETNLNAAYSLGNSIGVVYLVQGLRDPKDD